MTPFSSFAADESEDIESILSYANELSRYLLDVLEDSNSIPSNHEVMDNDQNQHDKSNSKSKFHYEGKRDTSEPSTSMSPHYSNKNTTFRYNAENINSKLDESDNAAEQYEIKPEKNNYDEFSRVPEQGLTALHSKSSLQPEIARLTGLECDEESHFNFPKAKNWKTTEVIEQDEARKQNILGVADGKFRNLKRAKELLSDHLEKIREGAEETQHECAQHDQLEEESEKGEAFTRPNELKEKHSFQNGNITSNHESASFPRQHSANFNDRLKRLGEIIDEMKIEYDKLDNKDECFSKRDDVVLRGKLITTENEEVDVASKGNRDDISLVKGNKGVHRSNDTIINISSNEERLKRFEAQQNAQEATVNTNVKGSACCNERADSSSSEDAFPQFNRSEIHEGYGGLESYQSLQHETNLGHTFRTTPSIEEKNAINSGELFRQPNDSEDGSLGKVDIEQCVQDVTIFAQFERNDDNVSFDSEQSFSGSSDNYEDVEMRLPFKRIERPSSAENELIHKEDNRCGSRTVENITNEEFNEPFVNEEHEKGEVLTTLSGFDMDDDEIEMGCVRSEMKPRNFSEKLKENGMKRSSSLKVPSRSDKTGRETNNFQKDKRKKTQKNRMTRSNSSSFVCRSLSFRKKCVENSNSSEQNNCSTQKGSLISNLKTRLTNPFKRSNGN